MLVIDTVDVSSTLMKLNEGTEGISVGISGRPGKPGISWRPSKPVDIPNSPLMCKSKWNNLHVFVVTCGRFGFFIQ